MDLSRNTNDIKPARRLLAASRQWRALIVAIACLLGTARCASPAATQTTKDVPMPPKTASIEAELTETVRLSETALAGIPADIDEYKLIRAERLLQPGKSCGGPQCWRLTYKRKELVPETLDAEVGKGGEVFIEVDLQARSAQVTGYGE